jgi:tetratricopeptide (TPR) repeat protein
MRNSFVILPVVIILAGAAILAVDRAATQKDGQSEDACQIHGAQEDRADPDKVIAACSAILEANKGSDQDLASALYTRGRIYRQRSGRDAFAAIIDFDAAIKLRPDDAAAYANRGDAHFAMHQFDQALRDFNHVVRLAPRDPNGFLYRAGLYHFNRDYERAIADYSEAIRLDPNKITAFLGRALAYASANHYEGAIEDYSHAIRLEAQDTAALVGRCRMWAIIGRLEEALADCNNALGSSLSLDALGGRGLVHLKMGNAGLAIADFDQVLESFPDSAEALYGRGLVKRMNGDINGADADMAAAKEINPGISAEYTKYGVPTRSPSEDEWRHGLETSRSALIRTGVR